MTTVLAVVALRAILRQVPAKPEPRIHRRGRPEDRRPVFGAGGCTGRTLAGEVDRW